MAIPFGFIDEVGLNVGDISQPFMAIGLFVTEKSNLLNEQLHDLHYGFNGFNLDKRKQLIQSLIEKPQSLKMHELNNLFLPSRHHEFKFDNLGYPTLDKYKQLLDIIFAYKIQFHCIIIDKNNPDFDRDKYKDYWHAYTKFTSLLIKRTTEYYKTDLTVILDYLNRPKGQIQICNTLNQIPRVMNSLQADSKSFLLLQVTDLLLGAVVFEKKKTLGIIQEDSAKSRCRTQFTKYLCEKLNRDQIIIGTTFAPIVFNVWDFRPKK